MAARLPQYGAAGLRRFNRNPRTDREFEIAGKEDAAAAAVQLLFVNKQNEIFWYSTSHRILNLAQSRADVLNISDAAIPITNVSVAPIVGYHK